MATRRLGRPRTRVYDLNYNLGESYYRNALEGLDRKYGKAPAETIEAPKRPTSVGDLESILVNDRRPPSQSKVISDALEEDQGMMDTLKRIQRARKTANFSAEAEFENSFFNRQEEVKNRYSEKMLDAVGIHGSMMEEETKKRRERQRQALEESTPKVTEKWIALRDAAQDSVDEAQARARARASKARLADLENEMDALVERTSAREKRLAGLRSILDSESSQSTSDSSSLRLRKKITTVTTTEKRSAK